MGAAGGDNGGLRPVPRIGPVFGTRVQHVVVFLRAADAGGLHAHGGGEIGGAEAHGLKARGCGGDFLDMGDAGRGFDDDLESIGA